MIKVLIVDDNVERIREIASCIDNGMCSIDYVTTKNEALCQLELNQYDLAIIDIMLPENISSLNPSKTGGIDLITDIEKRVRIKAPFYIVGITAYDDMMEENCDFFYKRIIPIFPWKKGDDSWKEKFLNKINYINLVKKNTPPKADIAIITAVPEEFEAIRASFGNGQKINIHNDPETYFLVDFKNSSGKSVKIVMALLPTMGLTAATNMTTKMIYNFSPEKIFMVGICGGIKGEVSLGDIVVATNTWDYGSGKIKPPQNGDEGYYDFEPSPEQISVEPDMIDNLKHSSKNIIKQVTDEWNSIHKAILCPNVLLGPMPSGASVICDAELFKRIVKPQHRKCLGLDMETYGIYYAVQHSSCNPIKFLSIKAVSDYADIDKNDKYHEQCCYFSSNFLKKCIYDDIL